MAAQRWLIEACGASRRSGSSAACCKSFLALSMAVSVPLLAYLRELQHAHGCAVALVHHARKGGPPRPGPARLLEAARMGRQQLYLRRDGERLLMSIEHRASASSGGIELMLGERGGGLSLHVREDLPRSEAPQPATPAE